MTGTKTIQKSVKITEKAAALLNTTCIICNKYNLHVNGGEELTVSVLLCHWAEKIATDQDHDRIQMMFEAMAQIFCIKDRNGKEISAIMTREIAKEIIQTSRNGNGYN